MAAMVPMALKYLDRLYYIKYTYLHMYMQTTKAIGDRACENRPCERKNRRFLACLLYHNLMVI